MRPLLAPRAADGSSAARPAAPSVTPAAPRRNLRRSSCRKSSPLLTEPSLPSIFGRGAAARPRAECMAALSRKSTRALAEAADAEGLEHGRPLARRDQLGERLAAGLGHRHP